MEAVSNNRLVLTKELGVEVIKTLSVKDTLVHPVVFLVSMNNMDICKKR